MLETGTGILPKRATLQPPSPLMSKYGFGNAKIPFAGHNPKHALVCESLPFWMPNCPFQMLGEP